MKSGKVTRFAIRLSILFILFISFSSTVQGGESLVVTPDHFNAGFVEEGQVLTVKAIVENRGDGIVEITNVRTN